MSVLTDVLFGIFMVWTVMLGLLLGWLVFSLRGVDRWSAEDRRETHRKLA